MAHASLKTYTNPVYSGSFPDPFVLKAGNDYFAFCTGHALDGRVFGVLTSTDLVDWHELPGAMDHLAEGVAAGELYWAPEVTFSDGTYHLYYSVGNETFMEIRVATSSEPAGPYVDTGRKLTTHDFAIDPHVFIDDDGSWHMFYATDFLDYSHIGTGTVVDRMLDPFTLAGDPRPVTRAKYDWQVYDPVRREKGGVRWHTVEGPFVLKRKGTYFEMFSGGNWQNITYGVGYAVSDSLERDNEWEQQVDGTDTLPLLRTIPEKVIGPGHNSVVAGPNGRELFCVYHRWQDDKRVMCIDRMGFAGGDRLFVEGPSYGPQVSPYPPREGGFEESFETDDLTGRGWSMTDDAVEFAGGYSLAISGGAAVTLSKKVDAGPFELAVNFRVDEVGEDDPLISFGCGPMAALTKSSGWCLEFGQSRTVLPDNFAPSIFHQYKILNDGHGSQLFIDGVEAGLAAAAPPNGLIEIVVRHATAVLDMVRYTPL